MRAGGASNELKMKGGGAMFYEMSTGADNFHLISKVLKQYSRLTLTLLQMKYTLLCHFVFEESNVLFPVNL